jgi:hypothetical protein
MTPQEQEQLRLLTQRITDIYYGAGYRDEQSEALQSKILAAWHAIIERFGLTREWVVERSIVEGRYPSLVSLNDLSDPKTCAKFLWRNGLKP